MERCASATHTTCGCCLPSRRPPRLPVNTARVVAALIATLCTTRAVATGAGQAESCAAAILRFGSERRLMLLPGNVHQLDCPPAYAAGLLERVGGEGVLPVLPEPG